MTGQDVHWLDRLEVGVKAHIQTMQKKRDELAAQARPPHELLDAADPETVKLGAGLNKAYTAALGMGKGNHSNALERAKVAVEDYLAHFPPERRGAVLLGALASVYGKEDGGADMAVWLSRNKEGTDQPVSGQFSIGHETIEALREVGLLDVLLVTKVGLVVYQAEMDSGK